MESLKFTIEKPDRYAQKFQSGREKIMYKKFMELPAMSILSKSINFMSKMGSRVKKCTTCDKHLDIIYAIYKLNYYCISCYEDEVQERKRLIKLLPDINPVPPPLGWLHKFQEEDLDSVFENLFYQCYRES